MQDKIKKLASFLFEVPPHFFSFFFFFFVGGIAAAGDNGARRARRRLEEHRLCLPPGPATACGFLREYLSVYICLYIYI